jgi:hypothetical protein
MQDVKTYVAFGCLDCETLYVLTEPAQLMEELAMGLICPNTACDGFDLFVPFEAGEKQVQIIHGREFDFERKVTISMQALLQQMESAAAGRGDMSPECYAAHLRELQSLESEAGRRN